MLPVRLRIAAQPFRSPRDRGSAMRCDSPRWPTCPDRSAGNGHCKTENSRPGRRPPRDRSGNARFCSSNSQLYSRAGKLFRLHVPAVGESLAYDARYPDRNRGPPSPRNDRTALASAPRMDRSRSHTRSRQSPARVAAFVPPIAAASPPTHPRPARRTPCPTWACIV